MIDATSESTAQTEPPAVLIVEDENALADLYAKWLADTYTVRTAYDGEEALEQLDDAIDVVLLDRRMPRISGDEVLAELREQDVDCRVVIVSAVTPDFDIMGMGFDEYLTKPVEAEELHDVVDRMLSRTSFDETRRELLRLLSTRATLETRKSEAELRASDEYAELTERIEELRAAADAALEDFTDADFDAVLRELDSDTGTTWSEDHS